MTADPELERKALALLEDALDQDEEGRIAWVEAQTADLPELRARTIQLLEALNMAGKRIVTGGPVGEFDEHDPPERIGSYRVVELLGQGGMGAVFKAERDTGDFDHLVAIKLIKPGALSDSLIDRFEIERQILANLSHPNIARLYDGGTTEEGGPFFVMEFIDGVPITQWAEQQALSLDGRLALMIEICEAVAFAHQNLIVHRDITPQNVLVTAEGSPKLIDFGIAQPQEEGAVRKATGESTASLSLTPGFAAPERYRGEAATTLTDVYSLGKLFERLIGDHAKDPDLSAIAAKATEDNPDNRYRTAAALAEDIDHYRLDEPVEARAGGRGYVFGKFVRRNTGAVAAVSVTLLLLIGALIGMAIGFQRAQVAQAEAESRYEDVRELANTLLFDIYDAVDRVPGSTTAREMLASTAQRYLDALAQDEDAPFDVRLEAGWGYMRLADVMGGVGGGTLGLRDEAMANYERADAILTALYNEFPDSEEAALALADLRAQRANTMVHIEEDMDRGLAFARSVEEILDRDCEAEDRCRLMRAQADVAAGQNLHWLERFDEALASFDRGLSTIAAMTDASRSEERVVRLRSLAHRMKSSALYYRDDIEEAADEGRISTRLLEQAIAGGMDGPDIQRDLAISAWDLGGTLAELELYDEAIASLDRAYEIMQRLVALDEDDLGSLRLLAVVGGQRSLTLSSAGRYRDAIAGAERSLAIRQRLSREQPDESGYFRDVIIQLKGLGDIYTAAGQPAQACTYYRRTVAQFDRLDERWGMSDFDRGDTYAAAQEALQNC